jgi:hypothetical protein
MRHAGRSGNVFAHRRSQGHHLSFLLNSVPGTLHRRTRAVSLKRTIDARRPGAIRHHLYMSHAPADPSRGARSMPYLRDGVGAGNAQSGRRGQSRASRLQPSVLVDVATDGGCVGAGDVRAPILCVVGRYPYLGGVGIDHSRVLLGWLAIPGALRAIHPQTQSQHVDPDRHRHNGSVWLQRRGGGSARTLSCLVSCAWSRRCVLRGGRRDRVADPAWTASGTEGTLKNVDGDQGTARTGPEDGTTPS